MATPGRLWRISAASSGPLIPPGRITSLNSRLILDELSSAARGFLADVLSQTQATLSAFGERALGALGASGGGLRAGGGGLLATDAREH